MKNPEANPPVPPAHAALSPSKANAAECWWRYFTLYVLEMEEPDQAPLLLGSLVHEIAAQYVDHLVTKRRSSDKEALERLMDAGWSSRPVGLPEGHYGEFKGLCEGLLLFTPDPEHLVESEVEIAFDRDWKEIDWLSQAVAYGGKLDLLMSPAEGLLTIIDWTTAGLSAQFDLRKSLQLRFYALLAWKRYGIDTIRIQARSLRTGAILEIDLDESDHQETMQRLEWLSSQLNNRLMGWREREEELGSDLTREQLHEMWPASPGFQCSMCSLPCPAMKAALARDQMPLQLVDESDAHLAHETLILLDKRRKELVQALRGYVVTRGPVESDGIVAEIRTQERPEWNKSGLYSYLQEHGIEDPWTAFNVNGPGLKRALRPLWHAEQTERPEDEARRLFLVRLNYSERFYPLAKARPDEGGDEDDGS